MSPLKHLRTNEDSSDSSDLNINETGFDSLPNELLHKILAKIPLIPALLRYRRVAIHKV